MTYRFEPAKPEEVPGVFSLFVRRVAWMKEKHICQWDQYYLDVYPLSYYQSQQEKGRLYVLKEKARIAGAVVLLSADDRWPDGQSASAFYLHNLVTDPDVKGPDGSCSGSRKRLPFGSRNDFCSWTALFTVFF